MKVKNTSWEIIPTPDVQIVKQGADHPAIGIWERSTCTEIAFVRTGKHNRAKLIASSPELLEACKSALERLNCANDSRTEAQGLFMTSDLEAAIKKATE